ncbi:MAG: hypothetical protein ABIY37_07555 [Devosia sp.]
MPHPRFPHRTYHRAAALVRSLDPLIAALDAIPHTERRLPMPPAMQERGWRKMAAARRTLGLPPVPDSIEREMPGELAAEIVSVLAQLSTLKPLQTKYTPSKRTKSYPRASERV